jgi:hypothetical protein
MSCPCGANNVKFREEFGKDLCDTCYDIADQNEYLRRRADEREDQEEKKRP